METESIGYQRGAHHPLLDHKEWPRASTLDLHWTNINWVVANNGKLYSRKGDADVTQVKDSFKNAIELHTITEIAGKPVALLRGTGKLLFYEKKSDEWKPWISDQWSSPFQHIVSNSQELWAAFSKDSIYQFPRRTVHSCD